LEKTRSSLEVKAVEVEAPERFVKTLKAKKQCFIFKRDK